MYRNECTIGRQAIVLYPLHFIFFSSNIFDRIISSVNLTTTSTSLPAICSHTLSIEVLQTDMAKKKPNPLSSVHFA